VSDFRVSLPRCEESLLDALDVPSKFAIIMAMSESTRLRVNGERISTLDFRHPKDDVLAGMDKAMREGVEAIANEIEDAKPEWITAGASVLIGAMVSHAIAVV
jgi:hypothetical protein